MALSNNMNFLTPIGYQFSITKLPSVGFYSQRVNLPGINLSSATQGTPFNDVPTPGEKLTWDTFSIDFMIDSNMDNYMEIWKWLIGLGHPNSYSEYIGGSPLVQYSDGVLQILTANNVVSKTIYFKDMFPTGLNAISFTSTEADVNYIQGTADFMYTSFRIE